MKAMINCRVPTEGGAELATNVYLPDGPGAWPVVLVRTPYHRVGEAPRAEAYTTSGYAFAVQDCRGKYDSTGCFRPMEDEAVDGAAALDWVANQRWCNGRIGLAGDSYLGMVQVPAAASGHEALRCIAPGIAPNTFFTQWARYGGCFALGNMVRWPIVHATCPTMPALQHVTPQELWAQPTLDDLFDRLGFRCEALAKWVEHDVEDDYWRSLDYGRLYPKVKVPGCHPAGWFDHISQGQFQAYTGLRDGAATQLARTNQRLLVGPWGHMNLGQQSYGDWNFGPTAKVNMEAYRQRFLDLWLRDIDDGISEEPPVRLFVIGRNQWMDFADWPIPGADVQAWHLRFDGRASRLTRETPDGDETMSYRYDPAEPVPTCGGPIYWGMEDVSIGPVSQDPILHRPDVLCYRGERLDRPLAVIGPVSAELCVTSDAEDTDFIAKLCVADPAGRITVLTVGSLRCRYRNGWDHTEPMTKGQPAPIRIDLGTLACEFPAGSRIALIVTSSSFPRILPNPNTMAPTWQERSPRVATNSILHNGAAVSRLLLPVVQL